ncbi:hypothetical protein BCR44DRAFT_44188 [Catenaria anguillulae PL171]|uniref:Uncharacterized protein n=1 Tax=Catenaria anguillulae PL171 TaxID=765915 RepID=A0A1Y2HYQ3_9FUNG|nr:hypothetical protein BCR44DRAFT_44188 [Catenaria anguillulae PL171]
MTLRHSALGVVGGMLAATTAYNFSHTSMQSDFDFLSSRLSSMSATLRQAARAPAQPLTSSFAPTAPTNASSRTDIAARGIPKPNLLTSFADAWNGLLTSTAHCITGRF